MGDKTGEQDVSSNDQTRYKRKRKKNFLKNARKYGKRGYFGRGSQLDEETYQYFVRIMEVYKEGFPSDEEKVMFVNNVFEQTEDKELNCSSNQLGCRVVQMLLPFASNENLDRYSNAFLADLRPLCNDRFASHVLQTLLEVSCKKSLPQSQSEENEFKDKCKNATLKISRFLLNNLEEYIWDTYANHVIRTVLKSLAQIPEEEKFSRNAKPGEDVKTEAEVPEEYAEVVKEFGQRILAWPVFQDLPHSDLTSGLLQILLKSLAKIDRKLLRSYLKKLVEVCYARSSDGEDEDKTKGASCTDKDIFSMSTAAFVLLETAVEVAPAKLYTQIYAKCFVNNLAAMAVKRSTNFCVQKLLNHCKEKCEFEAMFDELADHFGEILDAGHSGVVLALAQACKRLLAKQGSFIQNVMKAFNCYEPEERQNQIVICLCRFAKYEDLAQNGQQDLQKAKLNLHGTLIVQLMLEFNKPIKIVNSLLNFETVELKNLFSNTMGSHVVDSYVTSKFVGEKSREKLLKKMRGTYQDLAASKYGSRSFEAMWGVAALNQKVSILNELSHKDAAWSNSEFGKIIAAKVNLALFKRNSEDWKNSFNKGSKVQAMLADLIQK